MPVLAYHHNNFDRFSLLPVVLVGLISKVVGDYSRQALHFGPGMDMYLSTCLTHAASWREICAQRISSC